MNQNQDGGKDSGRRREGGEWSEREREEGEREIERENERENTGTVVNFHSRRQSDTARYCTRIFEVWCV